jgi:hypothetical protein
MTQRRAHSNDVLFISALTAVLLGIALLLYTTRAFSGALRAWPLLVIAVGGVLLYFALVRRSSSAFLFGGIAFVLEGSFFLVEVLLGWSLRTAWPLAMVVGGISGIFAGLIAFRRLRPSFVVLSLCFIVLGLGFSLFSFGVVRQTLGQFIVIWWPSFIILGGISLFAVYGLSRRRDSRSGGRPSGGRSRSSGGGAGGAGDSFSSRDSERES